MPQHVRVEAREDRWVVHLPESRLAWFAASDEGRTRLIAERRVLRLLHTHCSFAAPRILFEDATGDFDIRTKVPDNCDPDRVFAQVSNDFQVAVRLGSALGSILAEQHTKIKYADVADWIPRRPGWPESHGWIEERLVCVIDDPALIADAATVIAAYEAVPVSETDHALVHSDVGFHNLAIDPSSYTVDGIFDYKEAAWADRHHDFRYLVSGDERDQLLESVLSVYEPAVGQTIHRGRVLLYNAACAITFLASRAGRRAEERWCGRTLAEDGRWSKSAIRRVMHSNMAKL